MTTREANATTNPLVTAIWETSITPDPRKRYNSGLIGYTTAVFLGYIIYGLVTGEWSVPLGPLAKAIEVVLVVLLLKEDRNEARGKTSERTSRVGQAG